MKRMVAAVLVIIGTMSDPCPAKALEWTDVLPYVLRTSESLTRDVVEYCLSEDFDSPQTYHHMLPTSPPDSECELIANQHVLECLNAATSSCEATQCISTYNALLQLCLDLGL